jgi:hypothetical protein
MMKRFLGFILFLAMADILLAQDMPPLPPLPSETTATVTANNGSAAPPLPPLPDQSAAPASSSPPALPPLPDAPSGSAQSSPAMPPLPQQSSGSPGASPASPALPPLPDQNAQAAPATPPLPGDQSQTASPAQPPAAGTEAAPAAAPDAAPAPAKPSKPVPAWERTKHRPNIIFGGWIVPKGGNESSRLSWASQEVLNALLFKGFKVIKEEGKYLGQEAADGKQWRETTFSVPKSKLTVQTYLRQSGKKVWLRVGPSEPPPFSIYSIAQVQKMREADLKALHLIQKKLGRRLLPHRVEKSWEAPYSFNQEKVVE